MTGRRALHRAMKAFGTFSDTVTLLRDHSNDEVEDMNPRNAGIMIFLNEVKGTPIGGGGRKNS